MRRGKWVVFSLLTFYETGIASGDGNQRMHKVARCSNLCTAGRSYILCMRDAGGTMGSTELDSSSVLGVSRGGDG